MSGAWQLQRRNTLELLAMARYFRNFVYKLVLPFQANLVAIVIVLFYFEEVECT